MICPVRGTAKLVLVSVLLAVPGVLATGCGSERGEAPDLKALGPGGDLVAFTSRREEASFRHPESWAVSNGTSPQVAQLATGGALVSVYAYPRDDLGSDDGSVEAARDRLIESLRERAPGFLVQRTRIGEIDGSPSVEIRGRGTIEGRQVESRSTHVYKEAVEWVIDAYARPSQFEEANRIAFGPLLSSIELSETVETEEFDSGLGG